MKNLTEIENFWQQFCEVSELSLETPFQAWYFGSDSEMATELLQLVLEGKKAATAALVWEFENTPEDMPILDGYSVVTDFEGNPKIVVRTAELRVLPFNEVDEKFAFDEGEGDQSLDYWREVHWDYFSRRCAEIDREPSLSMPVICERFEVLYPKFS